MNLGKDGRGFLTFPTKFDMVDGILDLKYKEKVIIRMSLNPEEIINKVEFGTSRLLDRIEAINKLAESGYKVRNINSTNNISRRMGNII